MLALFRSEHSALLTRVSTLVDHSQAKMAVFRSVVGGYKSGQNGVDDVMDTLYNIFDHNVDATANIAAAAAMLLTGVDDDKKKSLINRTAVWRREVSFNASDHQKGTWGLIESPSIFLQHQADCPSPANAPRSSSSNQGVTRGTGYAGIASGRVVDVKQSLRGQASRQVWDRVERAAASPQPSSSRPVQAPTLATYATHFPAPVSSGPTPAQASRPASLVAGMAATKPKPAAGASGRSVPGSTAWASQQSSTPSSSPSSFPAFPPPSASLGPVARPTPVSINYASSSSAAGKTAPKASKPVSLAAFPSLPAANASSAAERRALFEKPSKRQEMLMRVTGEGKQPSQPVWGSGGSTPPAEGSSSAGDGTTTPPTGGGKKKGKGKEILFTISARPR